MRFTLSFGLVLTVALLSASPLAYSDDKSEQEKNKASSKEGPIRLESVFVGDKEQPAISYFIPWQGIGTPDKLHWNMEQKHDDELNMVNREVMLRSIQLYDEMKLEAP